MRHQKGVISSMNEITMQLKKSVQCIGTWRHSLLLIDMMKRPTTLLRYDSDDESITFDIEMNQDYVHQNGENRQVRDRQERENNLTEFTFEEAEFAAIRMCNQVVITVKSEK